MVGVREVAAGGRVEDDDDDASDDACAACRGDERRGVPSAVGGVPHGTIIMHEPTKKSARQGWKMSAGGVERADETRASARPADADAATTAGNARERAQQTEQEGRKEEGEGGEGERRVGGGEGGMQGWSERGEELQGRRRIVEPAAAAAAALMAAAADAAESAGEGAARRLRSCGVDVDGRAAAVADADEGSGARARDEGRALSAAHDKARETPLAREDADAPLHRRPR